MLPKFFLTLSLASLPLNAALADPRSITAEAVIETYADIALATYTDSLRSAQDLAMQIDALVETPSETTLATARAAWIDARVPYQQTEALRFGNPIVDQLDLKLNAWPVDESFIDYVDMSTQFGAPAPINLIANRVIDYNGIRLETAELSPAFLSERLHELGGNEAHVAIGYHALEFLLWGQDLNAESHTAGQRPATDFDLQNCTHEPCQQRIDYLQAVTDQLLRDLEQARDVWALNGAARQSLIEATSEQALVRILKGLGSLAYGELAGERMKLGLLLQDQEEEHDCFSDNTHNSHYYNLVGIRNFYFGTYLRSNGELLSGTSLFDLVRQQDPDLALRAEREFERAQTALYELKHHAETVEPYDQMISHASALGVEKIEVSIEALIRLSKIFERSSDALNLQSASIEGSDSLDNPAAVFE